LDKGLKQFPQTDLGFMPNENVLRKALHFRRVFLF